MVWSAAPTAIQPGHSHREKAFISAFNHPSMFHFDVTMDGAEALIAGAGLDPDGLFYLTARDIIHHEAIRSTLSNAAFGFRMRFFVNPIKALTRWNTKFR